MRTRLALALLAVIVNAISASAANRVTSRSARDSLPVQAVFLANFALRCRPRPLRGMFPMSGRRLTAHLGAVLRRCPSSCFKAKKF
jgi:hypothetical protein